MTASDKNKGISKTTATAVGAAALAGSISHVVHARASGKIKVGLLGCGGRGNGAIRQNLNADPAVEVIALADLFESKVRATRDKLMADDKYKGRVKIDDDHLFWGFDCHEKLAQCEADLLVMATAPAFRGRRQQAPGARLPDHERSADGLDGCDRFSGHSAAVLTGWRGSAGGGARRG